MYTILVVDDNRNIREFCRRELENLGYEVLIAKDGNEAVRLCDTHLPDLVVLDVHMPGLDGLQTIEEILTRHGTIPVILHTGHRYDLCFDHRRWLAWGCVEKSQDLGELRSAIAQALAERRLPPEGQFPLGIRHKRGGRRGG